MVSFCWETHGQNVQGPPAQLRRVPQTPREKVMAKRHLMLGRQGHRALGPSLAQHWSACSHHQTQRASHQLRLDHGWAGGWPQVKAGNCTLWVCSLL